MNEDFFYFFYYLIKDEYITLNCTPTILLIEILECTIVVNPPPILNPSSYINFTDDSSYIEANFSNSNKLPFSKTYDNIGLYSVLVKVVTTNHITKAISTYTTSTVINVTCKLVMFLIYFKYLNITLSQF